MSRPLWQQVGLFVVCGGVSAAGFTTTIVALVERFGWHTALATTAGFSVGTVISFTLNSYFTFQKEMNRATFARFLVVTSFGLALNISLVEGAQLAGLHYWFGIFGALVIAPAFNFTAHRFWTYA